MQRAIETINRNAKAQAQLIDDLLDVSRMIRGKLSLDVCPVDLVWVISDALNTVRPATEVKNISLEFLVDSDLEVRSQESGIRSQESGRGGFNQDISGTTSRLTNPPVQKSGVRSQESEIRNQKSEVGIFNSPCPLVTPLCALRGERAHASGSPCP